MILIDKTQKSSSGSFLSPGKEHTGKDTAPVSKRMFAGARVSRINPSIGETGEVNRGIYENLAALRGRSRQLAMDNPHIAKFLNLTVQETLGSNGLRLSVKGPKEEVNNLIEQLYEDWSEDCCTSGDQSLMDFEEMAIRTRHRDGEFYSRIVENYKDNKYKFAFYPFDADRLELGFDKPARQDGTYTRNAIEYNNWGRPKAYNILTRHPGDNTSRWPDGSYRQRISAKEILHYFEAMRPGQARGIPSIHAVISSAHQIQEYVKATIIAARIIASKFGAIKTDVSDPIETPGHGKKDSQTGDIINKIQPGKIYRLRAGESLDFYDPKQPSGQFGPFLTAILQGKAAGLGVSYASISGDLTKTSYASGRLGAIENMDYWTLKRKKFINKVKIPAYKRWLTWAYLTNESLARALPNARDLELYRNAVYVHDKPQIWVDPGITAKVIDINLKNGMTSLKRELAKQGIEYDPHVEQLIKEAEDMARLNKARTQNGEIPNDENKTRALNLLTS